MVVALVFAGSVALAPEQADAQASCTLSTTLRQGSTGSEVVCLQTKLGVTADGKFGPMTKAAVVSFQAANSLAADGVVGAMTRAALSGTAVVPGAGSLPAGCMPGYAFSSTTGVACTPTTVTLPAGCTSTSGFSVTTGAKCDGSTGSPSNEELEGGAGDLTVSELSSPSASVKVGEGEKGTKVLGIEYEADDNSDLAITSVKLSLSNGGSGSKKLNRYAESVSVWFGDKKVGSADASEFSENSNTYSKSINLSNVVVKAGEKIKVYVAFDAIADIDSGNTGSSNNTWTVTLDSTRYRDATGVVLTDSQASISNTAVFDTLSSTSDVELKVSLSSNTPKSNTVKVSTTSDTNQVELLEFTMKAQGTDMLVDQIPVYFETSETDLDQVTSNVTLKVGDQVFNESVSTNAAATATVLFDDLNLSIDAGDTLTVKVLADINDIEASTFDEGTTLYASLTSALVTATSGNYIDVEDSNGDQLVSGDRTGSASGNTITFRSTGVNVVMGTTTYSSTTDTNGQITSVTYTIPVAVTSFGNTLYMGQSAQLATTVSASNAFALVVETAAAPSTGTASATTSITLATSNAVIESNGFRLDDGQTKNFTVVVHMTAGTDNMSHRFRIDEVQTFTEAGLVTGTASNLLPVENYRTGFQYINN